MSVSMKLDASEFNQALAELVKISRSSETSIIKNTAKFVTKSMAILTRPFSERTRSIRRIKRRIKKAKYESQRRYWQKRLDFIKKVKERARAGWLPALRKLSPGDTTVVRNPKVANRNEGGIIDKSRKIQDPHITVFNEVPYIEALDDEKDILRRALDRQAMFMQRSIEKIYDAMLRKKSG